MVALQPSMQEGADVRFSNRPVRVKRFQASSPLCGVNVARGLSLLSGIGTKALPSWDSRANNRAAGCAACPLVARECRQLTHMQVCLGDG